MAVFHTLTAFQYYNHFHSSLNFLCCLEEFYNVENGSMHIHVC